MYTSRFLVRARANPTVTVLTRIIRTPYVYIPNSSNKQQSSLVSMQHRMQMLPAGSSSCGVRLKSISGGGGALESSFWSRSGVLRPLELLLPSPKSSMMVLSGVTGASRLPVSRQGRFPATEYVLLLCRRFSRLIIPLLLTLICQEVPNDTKYDTKYDTTPPDSESDVTKRKRTLRVRKS